MSIENKTEEKNEKVMTKYERKLEARKAAAQEEQKSWKHFKIGALIVGVAVVAAILFSIGMSAYNNYAALNKAYVKVGDHEITEVEFDYYFYNSVNTYLDTYGDYVSMFGLDVYTPLDQQQYSEELTWEDYFDESAVLEITRVKAMVDDAKANGFTYDDAEDVKNIEEQIAAGAEENGVTVENYYMMSYGANATAERIRPFLKENILAAAYQTELTLKNQPEDEAILSYYADNKMAYDLIDCNRFEFAVETEEGASEDEIAAAKEAVKAQAEEFLSRREDGEDFEALCAEYAPEDQKANYGGETPGSFVDDGNFYSVPSASLNWLYEDGRVAGDVSLFENNGGDKFYVVEYLDRSNDWESTSASIANSLATQTVNEYMQDLYDKYEVEEGRGKLMYLTLPEPTEAAETEAAE